MGLLKRLFGRAAEPARHSQSPVSGPASQLLSVHSQQSKGGVPVSQNSARREMLRVVLRDTMNRHGVPGTWISAETLVASSRARGQNGIHWRLSIKHWDARLPTHCVAFQNNLIKRVMTFDPMASDWLMGISWQFALEDESACPPMPHPGLWTAEVHAPRAVSPAEAVAGGVIAGPVRIVDYGAVASKESKESTAREDLEQLFAVRDADMKKHAESAAYDATQPMFARTEPAKL
ncbi:MAG: hypothetical protein ACXWJM_13930 [Ramlibacter sp.]